MCRAIPALLCVPTIPVGFPRVVSACCLVLRSVLAASLVQPVGCSYDFDHEELQGKVFFTTDATTVVAPTAFEAVSEYMFVGGLGSCTSRRRPLHGCNERWQFRLRRGGASGVAEGPWHTGVSSLGDRALLFCF